MYSLIPLAGSAYLSSAWLNAAAMKDPYFVPRMGGMDSDARWWGVGAGVLGLFFGPAMPFLASLGIGAGIASLINWNTTDNVKKGVEGFIAQQALAAPAQITQAGPAAVLPGLIASVVAPIIAEAVSPV